MADETRRLIIDAQARGTETLDKLNRTLDQIGESSKRVGRATWEAFKATAKALEDAAAATLQFAEQHKALTFLVASGTEQYVKHRIAVEGAVNSYRALRIALSPTAFTVATVAIGAATEATLRFAHAQGELIRLRREAAGLSGQASPDANNIRAFASTITGQSLGTLDPDKLQRVALQASLLPDPFDRAALALKEFGKNAEQALPLLTLRTADAIQSARRLNDILDTDSQAALVRLKDRIEGPVQALRDLAQGFRDTETTAAAFFLRSIANAERFGEAFGKAARAGQAGRFERPQDAPSADLNDLQLQQVARDLAAEQRRRLGEVDVAIGRGLEARERFTGTGDRSRINRFVLRRESTLEGARSTLSGFESQFDQSLGVFRQTGAGGQDVLRAATGIEQARARIKSLELLEAERAEAIRTNIEKIREQTRAIKEATDAEIKARGTGGLALLQQQALPGTSALDVQQGRLRLESAALGPAAIRFQLGRTRGVGDVADIAQRRTDTDQVALKGIQQRVNAQSRIVELLAGPGGEVAAIEKVTALRIAAAKEEAAITRDGAALQERIDQAELDRQVSLAELKRKQQNEFRESAGRVFDALVAGGAGLRSFASGFALTTGRTIFQNASSELFRQGAGRLQLPGQVNAAGGLTGFGRLLQGTPLGVDPLKLATDANTLATAANTAALLGARGGGVASGGLSLPIPGIGTVSLPGGLFGGGAGKSATSGPLAIPDGFGGVSIISKPTGGFGVGQAIGAAGIGLGTFLGVRAGINQGGVQGGLTTAATLAGGGAAAIATGLLGASAAAGPAAPILAGVGLALGVITSLFGDPKKKRAEQINRELTSRQYLDQSGADVVTDETGSSIDTNKLGQFRRGAPVMVVNQNFAFLDGQQIVERRADFVDAMKQAVADGTGNPFIEEVRSRILPA